MNRIALTLYFNGSEPISEKRIRNFANEYLETYNTRVDDVVYEKAREYLSFYKGDKYAIKATISSVHGAAIEFIPKKSGDRTFTIGMVNGPIESITHPDSNPIVPVSKMGVISVSGNPVMMSVNFPDIGNTVPFNLEEWAALIIPHMSYNDKQSHYRTIMLGSNMQRYWSMKEARLLADFSFDSDRLSAITACQDFRNLYNYPQFKSKVKSILDKSTNDEYAMFSKEKEVTGLLEEAKTLGVEGSFIKKMLSSLSPSSQIFGIKYESNERFRLIVIFAELLCMLFLFFAHPYLSGLYTWLYDRSHVQLADQIKTLLDPLSIGGILFYVFSNCPDNLPISYKIIILIIPLVSLYLILKRPSVLFILKSTRQPS